MILRSLLIVATPYPHLFEHQECLPAFPLVFIRSAVDTGHADKGDAEKWQGNAQKESPRCLQRYGSTFSHILGSAGDAVHPRVSPQEMGRISFRDADEGPHL